MRPTHFLLFTAVLLAAGCDTFDHRSKEKSAVYSTLSAEKQQKVKEGQVEIGDTLDIVYIALGKADEVSTRKTAAGEVTTWVYLSRYSEYAGAQHVGYERRVFYNPRTGKYGVALIPVEADVYAEHTEEALRVEFTDGKVSAIEQPKKES